MDEFEVRVTDHAFAAIEELTAAHKGTCSLLILDSVAIHTNRLINTGQL
jgi:hypothetical protein